MDRVSHNMVRLWWGLVQLCTFILLCISAVQEERQRNKEREGEYEFSSGVNEEMPVEKILEAETAVDHKTELHSAGSSGTSAVSKIH